MNTDKLCQRINKYTNEVASVSRTECTCSGSVYMANGVLACTAEATVCPVQPYSLHCKWLHKSTGVCQHARTHKPKVNTLCWKCVVLQYSSPRLEVWALVMATLPQICCWSVLWPALLTVYVYLFYMRSCCFIQSQPLSHAGGGCVWLELLVLSRVENQ